MALSVETVRGWSPRSWSRGDRRAVALLVGIPILLFVVPAVAGHPAIVGDNLLQNFPLRVLVGRQLDAGHWPVWNPYADSGTPLLGGWNAGAMYPGTLLFAVLPSFVAWVVNLLAVYWSAGLGLYALVRWLGCKPLAAGLAAATYAYSGAMVGELIHIGVVQGQSLLPWLVLSQLALGKALLGLGRDERMSQVARRALPGTVGLSATLGLVCLTGEPRSIVDAELVALVVLLVELVAHGGVAVATLRGRVAFLVASGVAVAWGVAIGMVQLAPGWSFISLTRRSQISYSFFSSGALPWRWLSLFFAQGLLGGNGDLATGRYFASYNLPEVTVAVGLAAVTAFAAACVQLATRRSTAPRRTLVTFVALAVVGVVLSAGPTTPIGPLLHHLPLYGSTRLQSRNVAIVGFAGAVLLAWWLNAVLGGRREEASLTGRRCVVTLAPLGLTALLCAAALIAPSWVTVTLLNAPGTAALAGSARALVAVSLLLAVAYLVVLWRRARDPARTSRALVAIVLIELVCFNVFYDSGFVTGLSTIQPSPSVARAMLGDDGRTAFIDPGVVGYHQTAPLGLANMNVFTRLPSVQGYGSLVAARYADATGTLRLGELDGCALARGVFVPLGLASIAVSPTGFATNPGHDDHATTCGPVRSTTASTRFFGGLESVASVEFRGPTGSALGASSPTVTLLDGRGRPLRVPVRLVHGRDLIATFPTAPIAAAVRLSDPRGFRLAFTTVVPVLHATTRLHPAVQLGAPEHLDTGMQLGLDQPSWHLVAVRGLLSFFRDPQARVGIGFVGARSSSTARIVTAPNDGSLTVAVDATLATTLARSEAWLPGWVATISTPGTSPRTVPVRPFGLIQSVKVPKGRSTVTFHYDAPDLTVGIAVSAGALAALLGALVLLASTSGRKPRASPTVR